MDLFGIVISIALGLGIVYVIVKKFRADDSGQSGGGSGGTGPNPTNPKHPK